jgi:hypothetical protein
VRLTSGLLHLDDLVEHGQVVAGQERSAIDDHVDLVGTCAHRLARLGQLDVEEGLAGREAGGHRRDPNARPLQGIPGVRHLGGIAADGGNGWDGRVARVGTDALRAECPDLSGRVLALQGGEIRHADRQVERPQLGLALDRSA